MPLLSIAENIFLGNEQAPVRRHRLERRLRRGPAQLLAQGRASSEDPDTLITNIGVGKQQLVEIAKALSKEVKLLILDEPTASLSEKDSDALLDLLIEFKNQGISSILICHKLNEVSQGRRPHHHSARRPHHRNARPGHEISEDRIITSMVGRTLEDRYPARTPKIGETIFEVKRLDRLPPAPRRPAGDQGRRHRGPQGRGGRHRRADGRRPHRVRDERVRRGLWGQRISGEVLSARQAGRHLDGGAGGRARPRLRHRGPQDLRAQPRSTTSSTTSRSPTSRACRSAASSTICASSRSPTTIASGPTSARPASIRRSATSPAATSRRWCCRSGCSPTPRC